MKKIFYTLFIALIFNFGFAQQDTTTYVGAGPDLSGYQGEKFQLRGQGGISYTWTPSSGLSDPFIANPIVTVDSTIQYFLQYQLEGGRIAYDTITIYVINSTLNAPSCSNWVNNGNFEDHPNPCTNSLAIQAPGWQNGPMGTVDYFNTCNGSTGPAGVPQSYYGYAYPHSGNGFGGIATASYISGPPTYFESYQQQLPCSLTVGQLYNFQFSSVSGSTSPSCGNIGALLSYSPPSLGSNSELIGNPQIGGNTGNSTSWTTYSTVITGNNESWLTISCFSLVPGCGGTGQQYNEIDDVILTPVTPTITSTANTQTICLGVSATTFSLIETGSPGNLASWSGPNGFTATGGTVEVTAPSTPGTYTYSCSVTLPCSICSSIVSTYTLLILPVVAGPSYSVTSTPTVCANYLTGNGSISVHVSGGPANTYYIWGPTNISSINPHDNSGTLSLPPGVYTYSVSNSGCSGIGSTTFTIDPFPIFTVVQTNTLICSGQSATLTATNPAFNYSWTPATGLSATTGSIVVANPTATSIYGNNHVYAATTTNSFGCVATETVSIKTALAPTVQIGKILTGGTCSVNHPTYTLTANGVGSGIGGTDVWTSPAITGTTIVVSPSSTTVYTLTETSALGCTSSAVTTATVNATPTVSIAASSTSACSGSSPTFTVYATPTNSATTYSWGGTASPTNTYTPPPLGPNVTNHTYTVHVNTSGCQGTATININYNPVPPKPTFGGSICSGATSVLTVTNTIGNETYSWAAPPGGSVSCNNAPTCNSETINNAIAGGVYSVTATDGNGCVSPTATIVPKTSPSVGISHAAFGVDCANSPKTYTLTGTVSPGTIATNGYNWSTGATTNTIVVTPTASVTTYTLVGTSGTTGCINTATVEIDITPNPTVNVTSSPVCIGATATLTPSASPSGTTNYTWVGYGVSGTNQHANPYITPNMTNLPRTYTLSANVNGCFSNTVTITVTPLSRPNITAAASPTIICQGSSSTLFANGAISYTWTPATTLSSNTGTPVIATPSVSTTYTVQGTDGNGCISLMVYDNVNVTPSPTLNITTSPTSHTICEGNSINLIAHGSTNYTWTPDPSLSATTGSVVTATPSVTTVYTVAATSTVGCNSIGTITITVTPAPAVIITAASNPICQGSNTTLTASGANTYTWTNGAGLGINATNNHSVTITTPNLTSTVTYTLTGTGTVGTCKGSTVLTVTVNPPPTVTFSVIPIGNNCSPTSTTVCVGDPVTITANSSTATDYTWNPGGSNDNPVTLTPGAIGNNIYTVTASDGVCTSTATTNIVVTNCTASLAHLPVGGSINGGNYFVPSSFTLGGNLSLIGCNVNVAPGVTITVPANLTLTINNSHLNAISNNMWQGILVQPGGTIIVSNNSMIEDAIVAIDNGGSSTNINYGNPAKVNVNGAIFNCNRTAIRQAFYQSTNPSNYGLANFSIQNAVVTCRCGISQTAGVLPLQVYSGGGTVTNPTIDDYYSVGNNSVYPPANLKYPYNIEPAYEGVHLENDGQLLSQSPTSFIFNIGSNKLIVFDNLTYGINVLNTSFSVTTSAFQLPRLSGNGSIFNLYLIGGYGINAINNTSDWYNGIYVKNSQFIRLVRGIHNINYYDIDINANKIFSQQVISAVGGPMSIYPPAGDYGMYLKTPRFKNANMSSNQIANINTCIDFVIDQNYGYNGGNGEYLGMVTVNTNTIVNQFSTTSYTNKFIGNGIIVDNVLVPTTASTVTPVTGASTEISVRNNIITQAYRGILVRNQEYQVVRDESNTISMQLETTNYVTATTQYGIEHNRVGYDPSAGLYPTITTNTVTGFITPADYGNLSYFEPKKGIWCNQTDDHYVTCNIVTSAGRGIEFTGNNPNTIWRLNQMNTSGEGFALSSASGGGIIGQQGAANDASDNQWFGFTGSNFETYTDINSSPNNSILYIQGTTTPYSPIFNLTNGGTPYSFGNGLSLASQSSTYQCSDVIAGLVFNSHQNNVASNARNANNGQGNSTSSTSNNNVALMEMIVQDSLHYMSDSAQNSFINKDIVYRSLRKDTTQFSGSTVLQNFYTASQTTCRQLFCVIEDSLHEGGYNYASGLVSSFVPNCTIEQNYKRFYQIYINAMDSNSTSADSTDLETIASSCPLLNGSVVFQARAFHNSLYNSFKHYEDNCPQNNIKPNDRLAKGQIQTSINKASSIIVYPNPNNGRVYITGFNANDKTTNIEITDVAGKLVYKQQNNIGNGIIELNLQLVSGVYFVHVINSLGVTQIQKIVIAN